ncbi:inositol monophosphatase family protein [Arcobacter sp. CECT 8985]|uniref:inositol monophosphatase family protein n=1 Tax=Arcobacter sp. CECT 8985 TaxID=1935424 RepID=UPI00100B0A03|nr:inositol monophosphatase family protein [Arcobacter sp. CECT 8985]RXJ87153.1 inositol phosphatase [Arcobacter sp. CECT 8985]
MTDFIKDCIDANKSIYEYVNTHICSDDLLYSGEVGFGGDYTLKIDLKAEEIFILYLKKYGSIFSEETGHISSNINKRIIIDPIDGSDNLATNLPYYGTSVALEENGKIVAGVVCNLATGILTYKTQEEKLTKIDLKTNKKIEEPKIEKPKVSIVERAYQNPKICKELYKNKIKFRSLGAIALSLCDARNYNFVLFLGKIREFDIAAGLYLSSDLNVYKNDKFLIVAKNIHTFNLVKDTINKL